jgi:hypothetical protein
VRVKVFQGADGLAGALPPVWVVGAVWVMTGPFWVKVQASAWPPVLFAFWH